MGEIFDDLSRIVATPMTRRQTMRLLSSTAIAGALDLRLSSNQNWAAVKKNSQSFDIAYTSALLRVTYLSRSSRSYRITVFSALYWLRYADVQELLDSFQWLLNESSEYGADGIETLILACADEIATRADKEIQKLARQALVSKIGKINFSNPSAPPNLLVPIGRPSSMLALDVRAAAVRTVLIALLKQIATNSLFSGRMPSLIDLLDSKETKEDLCNQPSSRDQNGNISPSDLKREKNCQHHGSAGDADGGTVDSAFGGLMTSGCTLASLDDIQVMAARIDAYNKCVQNQGGTKIGPDVGLGPLALAIISAIVGAIVGVALQEAVNASKTSSKEKEKDKDSEREKQAINRAKLIQATFDAAQAAAKANNEATTARDKLNRASEDYDNKAKAEKNIEKKLRDKKEQRQQVHSPQAKSMLDSDIRKLERAKQNAHDETVAAKATADAAKREYEKRQKEADDANADLQKKAKELNEAQGGALPTDDSFSKCADILNGNLQDRLIRERLGQDWASFENHIKDPRKINPNPEQTHSPFQFLRTPICGADSPTLQENGAEKCNSLVLCADEGRPDKNCGCNRQEGDMEKLMAKTSVMACSGVNCGPDAQPVLQGMVCVCTGARDEDALKGFTKPPRPLPSSIAAVFGNGKTAVRGQESPTFALVSALFQVPSRR